MFEYGSFSPLNSSPEALAAELTRKSSDGWEVVSIVGLPDGRFCAFLRRPLGATATSATASTAPVQSIVGQSPPADWYPDPSRRFEFRYWNGTDWTEHVARDGRQSVDPPVA